MGVIFIKHTKTCIVTILFEFYVYLKINTAPVSILPPLKGPNLIFQRNENESIVRRKISVLLERQRSCSGETQNYKVCAWNVCVPLNEHIFQAQFLKNMDTIFYTERRKHRNIK